MRAEPASTEEEKVEFLKKHEHEIRVANDKLPVLLLSLAREMKEAGMFSKKTYVLDIANGLRKRIREWRWDV